MTMPADPIPADARALTPTEIREALSNVAALVDAARGVVDGAYSMPGDCYEVPYRLIDALRAALAPRADVRLVAREDLATAIEPYEQIAGLAVFIHANRDKFAECDPDGVKRRTLDALGAAIDRLRAGEEG